jgi:hypothetical protein
MSLFECGADQRRRSGEPAAKEGLSSTTAKSALEVSLSVSIGDPDLKQPFFFHFVLACLHPDLKQLFVLLVVRLYIFVHYIASLSLVYKDKVIYILVIGLI